MKLLKSLFSILVMFSFFGSCKEDSKKETNKSASNSSSNTTEIDEKQAYINKYNTYVAVWNKVSPSVERSYNSLYNTINDKTGKPLKEKEAYYIPAIVETSTMKNLETFINKPPKIKELDELGPQLLKSYQEMLLPLQQLSDYYKLQSYKDDDYKKGIELYYQVRQPIGIFIKANKNLGSAVQTIDEELSKKALAEYKEKDQLLLYHKGMIINNIKKGSAPLYGINYKEYKKIDSKKFKENLQDVVKHYNAFKELANDKKRLKEEMNISRPSQFIIYYNAIDDYVKTSRGLLELLENPEKYDKMKSKVKIMGFNPTINSHKKVVDKAEGVINQSNYLN